MYNDSDNIKNENTDKDISVLLSELRRLVQASRAGDFSVTFDGSAQTGGYAEALKLLNEACGNYRAAVEYELMKYKLTSDALGIGVWSVDIQSNDPADLLTKHKFTWESELRQMLGYAAEEDNKLPLSLSDWVNDIHPQDRERVVGAFTAHLYDRTDNTPFDVEYRLKMNSGEYRHVRAFGKSLRNAEGIPIKMAGASEDIEEKVQMRKVLDERRSMLDALNSMAVKLMSFEDERFADVISAGLKCFAAVGGIDRVAVYRRFNGITDMGQIYLWYGDTQPLDEILIKLPIVPPVLRWISMLSKGNYVNSNVQDMAPDEAAFANQFGIKGIVFMPIFVRDRFWGVVTFEDHTTYRHFDDENIDLLRSAAYLCCGAVARDEMEQEISYTNAKLKQALVEATAASRAKSNFLSNMSHEIRTPMNAIIGMTAVGKNAETIEQKNRALSKIHDASSHLLDLINDVLDMAKIEADKLELVPVEYNFEKMLQKVLTVISFRLEEKLLRLTINIDESIPKTVIGDDKRLAQIITNLLSNAVKFTPQGGEICFDARMSQRCTVGRTGGTCIGGTCPTDDRRCELRIEVSDSGIGLSSEQQARVFSAFEQAENSISREYGGTGLGLGISKRLAEMMDGSISVESQLGRGAKFVVYVKIHCGRNPENIKAEAAAQSAASEQSDRKNIPGEFSGKTMLLAEDIEVNREIMIALLEHTGLKIECAENGKIAFDMVEANPDRYDIILMDIQMPQMDGLEASRRIRALPDHKCARGKLPIIAMTANVFKSDIEACIYAGMDDHLGKPLDMDKVLSVLRRYLL